MVRKLLLNRSIKFAICNYIRFPITLEIYFYLSNYYIQNLNLMIVFSHIKNVRCKYEEKYSFFYITTITCSF